MTIFACVAILNLSTHGLPPSTHAPAKALNKIIGAIQDCAKKETNARKLPWPQAQIVLEWRDENLCCRTDGISTDLIVIIMASVGCRYQKYYFSFFGKCFSYLVPPNKKKLKMHWLDPWQDHQHRPQSIPIWKLRCIFLKSGTSICRSDSIYGNTDIR